MQKTIKTLAIALLALSSQYIHSYTGKTYLADRPKGVDSLLEKVGLQNMNSSKAEDAFGATFQATLFYNESLQSDKIAQYFLTNDKSSFDLTRNQLRLVIPDHNPGHGAGQPLDADGNTTIKLNPTVRTYGFLLSYYQDLEKILPGLYFNVRAPLVEVDTDLGAVVSGANAETTKKFLNGSLNEIPATQDYARESLRNARYAGKNSAIGIADIDLRMGYAFLQRESCSLGLNVGLTIPTSLAAESKQVFEAIYGNGGHWGFGFGAEGKHQLWSNNNASLDIHANSDYRYLFTNTERRTFGLKGEGLGQYRIIAKQAVADSTNTAATPAANALTINTDVTPNHQLDTVVGLTYSYGGLLFDLGYNLYFRNSENLKLRDAWSDSSYVLVTDPAVHFGGGAGGGANFTVAGATHKNLTNDLIDWESAKTPSQLTNKILVGAGYIFKEWEYPIMLGVGGHYEIPSKNSALRTWGFYFKSGVSF